MLHSHLVKGSSSASLLRHTYLKLFSVNHTANSTCNSGVFSQIEVNGLQAVEGSPLFVVERDSGLLEVVSCGES